MKGKDIDSEQQIIERLKEYAQSTGNQRYIEIVEKHLNADALFQLNNDSSTPTIKSATYIKALLNIKQDCQQKVAPNVEKIPTELIQNTLKFLDLVKSKKQLYELQNLDEIKISENEEKNIAGIAYRHLTFEQDLKNRDLHSSEKIVKNVRKYAWHEGNQQFNDLVEKYLGEKALAKRKRDLLPNQADQKFNEAQMYVNALKDVLIECKYNTNLKWGEEGRAKNNIIKDLESFIDVAEFQAERCKTTPKNQKYSDIQDSLKIISEIENKLPEKNLKLLVDPETIKFTSAMKKIEVYLGVNPEIKELINKYSSDSPQRALKAFSNKAINIKTLSKQDKIFIKEICNSLEIKVNEKGVKANVNKFVDKLRQRIKPKSNSIQR
ncbi:MAG: hypothetical protein EKK61_03665 [Rickettsiales bacterium]|nr:MAG: hypothetical protein EKK61_03665 [Rickettsiales bacterium]